MADTKHLTVRVKAELHEALRVLGSATKSTMNRMIVEAIDHVGNDGTSIQQWLLENIHNWPGLMGIISFDEKGNTDSGYVLKQMRNGSAIIP